VNGGWSRAAGAGRQCAPAALIGRLRAAARETPVVTRREREKQCALAALLGLLSTPAAQRHR
jgi:hypothetical protein